MPDRSESLIRQCVERATADVLIDELVGEDTTGRELAKALWLAVRRGSNAAALVVDWAYALDELGADELGTERFVECTDSSRRTVYRRLADFRSIFPNHDTPNDLARQVLVEARRLGERPSVRLQVTAA